MGSKKGRSLNGRLTDDSLILDMYTVALTTKQTSFNGTQWKHFKVNVIKKLNIYVDFVDLNMNSIKRHSTSNYLQIGLKNKAHCVYLWELVHHLRNAYCHQNILENEDETITLQDCDEFNEIEKGKLTAYGNVDKDKFKRLISELKCIIKRK